MQAAEPMPPTPEELASLRCLLGLPRGDLAMLSRYLSFVSAPSGGLVVLEGASDRAMYIVWKGEATVSRSGLEVTRLKAGDHFGELALITGQPRHATVEAQSELSLLRLSDESYRALSEQHPQVALHLLQALLATISGQLAGIADSVGLLLRERSLPRRAMVDVQVMGKERTIRNGTPVAELLPQEVDARPVVAGLIDHRACSLSTPVSGECAIEPLTTAHWEGERIFRDSLALLLMEAAFRLDPRLKVQAVGSLGFAQRVIVEGSALATPTLADRLQEGMEALVEDGALLREELWTVEEAREHFHEVGSRDAVELLSTWRGPAVPLVSFGEVYALKLGPLVPRASALLGFEVLPDDGGLLLVYDVDRSKRQPFWASRSSRPPRPSIPADTDDLMLEAQAVSRQNAQMTESQERWLRTLGITSIGSFNRACIDGDVSQLIRVSEGFQEKALGRIADQIRDAAREVRVVCVAGPSSSGKTTFIKRLRVQLQVNGLQPIGLSLDDYYVDRERTPRDENGEWDFEALEAIQVDLLRQHLGRLLAGETASTAHYDFGRGVSLQDGGPQIKLGRGDILLMEGIHGLNPSLLATVPANNVFRIFICPLAQLPFDRLTRVHASDLRLLRRIVRDRHARGHDAAATVLRWPSVRAGERKHIFPFQGHADTVFDSSLIYELSVLKVYAERYLLEVPPDSPAKTTTFRLLQLLDQLVSIYPDHVPPTSLLREFIGGSGFEY